MKIWIVDDLAQTRSWLRDAANLAFADAEVHEARDLYHASRLRADHGWPDLALIDLRLPDGRGHTLIAELRSARPKTMVLIPTIFDDDAYLFEAIVAGASGHVLKDQPVERISAQLDAHVAGCAPPLSPSLARRILRQLEASAAAELAPAARLYLQLRARGVPAREAQARSDASSAQIRDAMEQLRDGG